MEGAGNAVCFSDHRAFTWIYGHRFQKSIHHLAPHVYQQSRHPRSSLNQPHPYPRMDPANASAENPRILPVQHESFRGGYDSHPRFHQTLEHTGEAPFIIGEKESPSLPPPWHYRRDRINTPPFPSPQISPHHIPRLCQTPHCCTPR